MIDGHTTEQIAIVLDGAGKAIDQIIELTGDRDLAFRVAPSSTFLNFAALSQLARQSPTEQVAWINAALADVGQVMAGRGARWKFRQGSKVSPVTREMVEKAVELGRTEIGKADLVVDRALERKKILFKALLEFAATAKLLGSTGLGPMMSLANELVAKEIAEGGPLGKNTVKIE